MRYTVPAQQQCFLHVVTVNGGNQTQLRCSNTYQTNEKGMRLETSPKLHSLVTGSHWWLLGWGIDIQEEQLSIVGSLLVMAGGDRVMPHMLGLGRLSPCCCWPRTRVRQFWRDSLLPSAAAPDTSPQKYTSQEIYRARKVWFMSFLEAWNTSRQGKD